MSIHTEFDRALYRAVVADVRRHKPDVKLREAWVYHFNGDDWEFHYQDFYWYGSASGAYEARAEGWSAWLDAQTEGHPKVPYGRCPICGHYGEDCTGASGEKN